MVFNQNYKKHFPTSLVCKLTNNSIRTKQRRKYKLRAKPYGFSFQKKEKHPLCRNTRRDPFFRLVFHIEQLFIRLITNKHSMKPVALTREQKIRKSVRGFIITFLVFLIFRYYLAELALNNKPSMKRGMVLSLFYAMAYVVSSNTL